MIIGVMSDSHGRADRTRSAVRALRDAGADLLIHLGDVGGLVVLETLAGEPVRLVFGNCDSDVDRLREQAEFLGICVDHPAGRIDVDGRRIAFMHGHLEDEFRRALDEPVDYLLHGHTHTVIDERRGATRVINPGALSRADRYTVATLDVAADRLTILDIPMSHQE